MSLVSSLPGYLCQAGSRPSQSAHGSVLLHHGLPHVSDTALTKARCISAGLHQLAEVFAAPQAGPQLRLGSFLCPYTLDVNPESVLNWLASDADFLNLERL